MVRISIIYTVWLRFKEHIYFIVKFINHRKLLESSFVTFGARSISSFDFHVENCHFITMLVIWRYFAHVILSQSRYARLILSFFHSRISQNNLTLWFLFYLWCSPYSTRPSWQPIREEFKYSYGGGSRSLNVGILLCIIFIRGQRHANVGQLCARNICQLDVLIVFFTTFRLGPSLPQE